MRDDTHVHDYASERYMEQVRKENASIGIYEDPDRIEIIPDEEE